MSIKSILLMLYLGLLTSVSLAQLPFLYLPERVDTREGNRQYLDGKFSDAEAAYKKALDKKNNMPEAQFNLGNAIYEQKRYDTAIAQFRIAAQTNPDTAVKTKALHNLGNCYMQQQKWKEAIEAYKQSLKLNPTDTNTKYNLAYANEKLREQQKQNQQNNKDRQQQKQQDQKQNEQKQDQPQKDQQQKQQPQPKLTKEEAEKLLQALQNEEQKTNQKMQQKQVKAVKVKIEKDW